MADELVMECLVRAIDHMGGFSEPLVSSLPQKIAAERLIAIARAENPKLFDEICKLRVRCLTNLVRFVEALKTVDLED